MDQKTPDIEEKSNVIEEYLNYLSLPVDDETKEKASALKALNEILGDSSLPSFRCLNNDTNTFDNVKSLVISTFGIGSWQDIWWEIRVDQLVCNKTTEEVLDNL